MRNIPYASAVGSLMYTMFCARSNINYAVSLVSRYQYNPGSEHWTTVKNIVTDLKRVKHYSLVFGSKDLVVEGYTDFDFNRMLMIKNSQHVFSFFLVRKQYVGEVISTIL